MGGTTFACAFNEETRTLIVAGEIDEAGALELRQQVAAYTHDLVSPLVVDLSRVESLPSAGIGVIAAARAGMRAHHSSLILVSAPGTVARHVLTRCGMSVRDV